jgi:adenylate cyclase
LYRRVAAILVADVVGYSRLMGEDEAQTIAALAELRKTLFEPLVAARGGTVIKRMGDGWIVEYANVSGAITSAIEIQQGLADHKIIRLRIGVHVGDVTSLDDDIYGDGVNVAARLEAMAEPGQVLISDTAYKCLDRKAAHQFGGGEGQELKNIARSVAVWRWPATSDLPPGKAAENSADTEKSAEKPSIAILPFENRTSDDDIDFFSTGLAEDILTALTRVAGIFVIARDSSFSFKDKAADLKQVSQELGIRYVLQGSVRKAGERVRVSAKLTDTVNGSPIWAETYNRTLDDIFDLQDDITKEIVTALRVKFTDGETAHWVSRGTSNIDAWRLAGEGFQLFQRFNLANTKRAQELLKRATEADPNYAFAWGQLALTYWFEARINADVDVNETITLASECARQAMASDAHEPWAIGSTGLILTFLGNHDAALAIAREGVAKNPGSAEVRAIYSFCLGFANKVPEAIEVMEEAIRLNPLHPEWYLTNLPRLYDQVDRTDDAISVAEKALQNAPNVFSHQLFLASLYGRQGRMEDAKAMAAALLQLTPNFTVSQTEQYLMNPDVSYLKKFSDGLIRAGLPE